jgi:hypothetical protein
MGGGVEWLYKKVNDDWIAEAPMGRVKVAFAEKNELGVLDHDVTLESGARFYNPMRVFPNNDGSELVFTLYRQPNIADQKFAEDTELIEKDLKRLKALLEK